MDTKQIFKILDRDIRLNYNSQAEYSRKVGVSNQGVANFLKVLKQCKERNTFNRICHYLEVNGKRIAVLDENNKEVIID